MKNSNVRITATLFVAAIACLTLFTFPLNAQIGNLGMYGSAPTPSGTPFTCGAARYANLQTYPELDGGVDYTLPLNGLKNFNFFYAQGGVGFLSGGGYKITYRNASGVNCYGNGDIVTYSPNSRHTDGIQVRPFNSPPGTPRGIHAIVKVKIPGGGGATTFLANATAEVGQGLYHRATTNSNGYFSIYYSYPFGYDGFVPFQTGSYPELRISGMYGACAFTYTDGSGVIWLPALDPNSPSYFVQQAEADMLTYTLESQVPGCTP